jgi:hypothetical protein
MVQDAGDSANDVRSSAMVDALSTLANALIQDNGAPPTSAGATLTNALIQDTSGLSANLVLESTGTDSGENTPQSSVNGTDRVSGDAQGEVFTVISPGSQLLIRLLTQPFGRRPHRS